MTLSDWYRVLEEELEDLWEARKPWPNRRAPYPSWPTRLIFADWCEEHGEEDRAALQRELHAYSFVPSPTESSPYRWGVWPCFNPYGRDECDELHDDVVKLLLGEGPYSTASLYPTLWDLEDDLLRVRALVGSLTASLQCPQ